MGSLPDGLTLASNGLLSGTPTTAGNVTFTITATDDLGCTGKRQYHVIIAPPPEITVSPASITFTGAAGGPNPDPQSIQVTTSNGAHWHSVDTAPWFNAHPTSGASGASTKLVTHIEGLAEGTYTESITFSANGLPSKVVVVTLILTAPGAITVSPDTIHFTGAAGGANPAPQTIKVTTSNGATWQSFDNSPWFSAHPTSGASGTSTTLTPHIEGLADGTYAQKIVFSAHGLPNKVVIVTLTLTGSGGITVSPDTIHLTGVAGGPSPGPQSIQITTSNGTAWHSFDNASWFDLHPASGASGTSTALTPHTEALDPGTYTQQVVFSATGLPKRVVSVILTLTPPPPFATN